MINQRVQKDQKDNEALIFGKYLIGVKISEHACDLYANAIAHLHIECIGRDKKIENFILRFPFRTGFADAALALTCRQSVFREKYLSCCQSLKHYQNTANIFFQKFSFFRFLMVLISDIRSAYRFIIGFLMIQFFGKA